MGHSIVHVSEACYCGGRTDGTPSGIKRHEATKRHQDYRAGIETRDGFTIETPAFTFPKVEYDTRTWEEQRVISKTISDEQALLKKRQADLRWSQKHNASNVAQIETRQARVDEITALMADLEADLETLREQEKASMAESYEKVYQQWLAIADAVAAKVGATPVTEDGYTYWILDGDIRIRHQGEGSFEISYLTGETKTGHDRETGKDFTYPETRYDTRVSGPRERGYGEDRAPEAATLGWYSANTTTPAEARTVVRIYTVAITVCEAVNSLLGLA